MAGRLFLLLLLTIFFHGVEAASPPPELTVHPTVISKRDMITFHCRTPSSEPVNECFFNVLNGNAFSEKTCRQTMRGSRLLTLSTQRSPSEIIVKCFYTVKRGDVNFPSQHSNSTSITIKSLPLPRLTVTPSVITDTDLVTLHCQTPSSESQCYFYAVSKAVVRQFSCLKTLTGSELLKTWALSSPAEVEVRCFYTVESEGSSSSEESNTASVTVHWMRRPEMSVQHIPGEHVDFVCSLPGSADEDTKCNLYIGEASRPVETRSINSRDTSKNQSYCIFSLTIDDLLRYLHWVKRSEASCDYSFGRKTNSLSPRSDGYSLTHILKNESNHSPPQAVLTPTTDILNIESDHSSSQAALTTTIDTTVISPDASTLIIPFTPPKDTTVISPDASTFVFPVSPTTDLTFHGSSTGLNTVTRQKSASETFIWILVLSVAGFGVTMGIITLGLTLFCTKRRTEKCSDKRTKDIAWDEPVLGTNVDCGESVMCQLSAAGGYSVITSVPGAVHPPAPETVNKQMLQRTLSDHCYAYITFEGPSVQHREGTNESLV